MSLGYIKSPRVTVIDEPEYTASYHTCDLGAGQVMTFVHLDVYYCSPSIMRRLKAQWSLWQQHYPGVLYVMSTDDDEKWSRFIRHFGFEYLRDVVCDDGVTRRLFVNLGPNPREP